MKWKKHILHNSIDNIIFIQGSSLADRNFNGNHKVS